MNPLTNPRKAAGTSLVEIMVGMVIGLIGIIIISHLYIKNEQYKRSTTGSGSAQVNGSIALYTLERDIRMAGFGVAHSAALNCGCAGAGCSPVKYHYNGGYSFPPAASAGGAKPSLAFAPLLITDNTGAPDSITVLYTTGSERMLPGKLAETMPTPAAAFKVDGTAGYTEGGLVVVTENSNCAMYQITKVIRASQNLEHTSSSTAPWNPASGSTLPAFGAGALLFNLGSPVWRTYAIGGNALQATEALGIGSGGPGAGAAQALVDEIVDLQVEYGKNTNNDADNVVDAWNATVPSSGADWQQVVAVRLAILMRSQNYEKPDSGATCTATTAAPAWSSAATNSALTVPGGLPSCYKHRVFETIVPLRNMIWRPA
jgi:type IV pilus assembly protein PilW